MAASVTLSDVAREAGVSLATASRAINGSANRTVRADLRDRVLAAATRLRYTPDANAQAMARGRTTSLGLVVHDIADPYFSSIAAGVARAADRAGLQVTLASTQHDPSRESGLVDLLKRQRARAIVIAGGRLDDEATNDELRAALADYRSVGGSVALIGQPILGVDSIVVDNAQGAGDLAKALHGRGYRRFAILAGPADHLTACERRDAFRGALAELGSPVPDDAVITSAFTHEGGEDAMRALLRRGELPELVFAVNDVMALGALAAGREAGIRVPEDVALAGFDDISTLRDVVPALTTVRIPLVDIGIAATELALADASDEPRLTHVPTQVVLRDSTPGRSLARPDARRRVLEPEQVRGHPQACPVGVAGGDGREDRLVLDERPVLRTLVGEPAPQPGPGRPPRQALDERREHGVAGRPGDLLVEGQVRVDEPLVVEREVDQGACRLVEDGTEAGERSRRRCAARPGRRPPSRGGGGRCGTRRRRPAARRRSRRGRAAARGRASSRRCRHRAATRGCRASPARGRPRAGSRARRRGWLRALSRQAAAALPPAARRGSSA